MSLRASVVWMGILICATSILAQESAPPVKWSLKIAGKSEIFKPGDRLTAVLEARIAPGWHVYSLNQPPGGPVPTLVRLPSGQPFELASSIVEPPPERTFDPNFNMETEFYSDETAFLVPVRVMANATPGDWLLKLAVRFQICNDQRCLPPSTEELQISLKLRGGTDQDLNSKIVSKVTPQPSRITGPTTKAVVGARASGGAEGGLQVGAQVPEFSFTDFDGKERKFSEFRGKYVLIDFWATWCKPCLADIPHLKELYEKYKAKGFEILGMDSETLSPDEEVDPAFAKETQERARNIVKTRGASWTHATSETAVPVAIKVFKVESLPTKVLIDREGKVVARVEDGAELDAWLQKLLGAKP